MQKELLYSVRWLHVISIHPELWVFSGFVCLFEISKGELFGPGWKALIIFELLHLFNDCQPHVMLLVKSNVLAFESLCEDIFHLFVRFELTDHIIRHAFDVLVEIIVCVSTSFNLRSSKYSDVNWANSRSSLTIKQIKAT